jgi:glyoxylase-like metal-dependent hydrolase (beta-lactamase superfamily II)
LLFCIIFSLERKIVFYQKVLNGRYDFLLVSVGDCWYNLRFKNGVSIAMIGFCPLASGSKGNCIYLGTATTKVLIDAGISAKLIRERLLAIGVQLEEIDAVLITHEHTDHIKALDVLGCKM